MSTMSVESRRSGLRRPVYRRPEWSGSEMDGFSNTWGEGSVRTPSVVQRQRYLRQGRIAERPFEPTSRYARMRRRASMVVGSPGMTVLSLATLVAFLAVSPAVTGPQEDTVTPTGTTTVTVSEGQSLAEIAEQHVHGASVGDAVARIASLNDVSELGGDGDHGDSRVSNRDVVIPVY